MASTLAISRTSLLPAGTLRLRSGKAASAAPAGEDVFLTFVAVRSGGG